MQTLRRDDGMNRKQVVYLADVIVKKTKGKFSEMLE